MIDKITALYARFSRDEKQDGIESVSIANQRHLLQEYADNNGYTNCKFYVDDGYTGTNFDRPDFQRMLEDAENGLISTIIVKDMSRFGRNYILVGKYVEFILPEYGVRVIGIDDNYNSSRNDNDLFAFENILNEMYTADISKKVTMVKRAKAENGGRLKTHPIYGYKTVKGTIDDWEIDEEAAEVVRLIFDMYVNKNMSTLKISRYLRSQKIETSHVHFGYSCQNEAEPYKWSVRTIRRMLSYQEYCGDTVNGKTKTINYKTKERCIIPKKEWKIFKDTHPAIISRELFEKAQKKLQNPTQTFSPRKYFYDTLFHKKCICSECGKRMKMNFRTDSKEVYFQCYDRYVYNNCKSHNIRESYLRKMFSIQLKKLHNELISDEKQILKKIGILELSDIQTELNSKIKRIEEIQKLIKALFESKYNGEVTENDFKILSKKYFDEREEIQKSVNLLTAEVNKRSKKIKGTIETINYVKNLSENEMTTPTQELCDKLIEKIIIGEFCGFGEINFGKQQVDIYLYDIGKIGDIVDVAYKTYEERVKAVLPEVIKSGEFSVKKICEAVGIEQHILRDGLKREGLTFKDFKKLD